jgi:hypothetical protein
MKKMVFILMSLVVLASCGTKESTEVPVKSKTVQVVDAKIDFSDPARMGGSSFGEFFISMIRTQNYNMALKFTSKGSIEKFGSEKILDKYKDFSFNYKLVQKSVSTSGDTITLKYSTDEYATSKLKTMVVVVENDSCKLVLPENLDDLLK